MPLNERQLQTYRALSEVMIPPDDFPGGWSSGAGEFALGMLQTERANQWADSYGAWLDELDSEAANRYEIPFDEITPYQQTELIVEFERENRSGHWRLAARIFAQHLAEGYYNNPLFGGNLDAKSWEMIGFPVEASRHAY